MEQETPKTHNSTPSIQHPPRLGKMNEPLPTNESVKFVELVDRFRRLNERLLNSSRSIQHCVNRLKLFEDHQFNPVTENQDSFYGDMVRCLDDMDEFISMNEENARKLGSII